MEDEDGEMGRHGDGQLKVGGGETKEKVGVEAEKPDFLGIKLRKGILLGRKGGALTPVPSWKMELSDENGGEGEAYCGGREKGLRVSARKLGANLWELQKVIPLPPPSHSTKKMKRGVKKVGQSREKGLALQSHLADPSHSPTLHEPPGTGSLRRQSSTSLIKHHKLVDGNGEALQPLSPTSFGSSMEIAAYNQPFTPTSSLDIKVKTGELGYKLTTSTELLKVLNRIWMLEEQHASDTSLIKTLKLERDRARARIQELIHVHQADRQEMDDLMKQFTEEKIIRKTKEHERVKEAIQLVREELEDERQLRRRSESLHRKLAREIADMRLALSKSVKELEREQKTRLLLENLCDEFARGIGDYEQEVHSLKQKYEKDRVDRDDRFILHIAEAWLDERVQMKVAEAKHGPEEKHMIVDRLQCEIETFLRAKQSGNSRVRVHSHSDMQNDWLRRHSLESVPLNEAASGPQYAGDEDSVASDLHCFNTNKNGDVSAQKNGYESKTIADIGPMIKPKYARPKVVPQERMKGQSSANFQIKFEDKVSSSRSESRGHFPEGVKVTHIDNIAEDEADKPNQIETPLYQKSEICETHGGLQDKNSAQNAVQEKSLGSVHEISSLTQKSASHQSSPDLELAQSCTKVPWAFKKSTLKAKLLEARLEGQQARLRVSKAS